MPTTRAPILTMRFTVDALGPARTERQLRRDLETAFDEALSEAAGSRTDQVRTQVTIEPEGGFLGGGLELWLLIVAAKPAAIAAAKLAGGGAATALGKKVVDSVWDGFARRLKKRNILVKKDARAKPPAGTAAKKAAGSRSKKQKNR